MSKIVDITDKLSFDTNPKFKIKGKEYEVNADAETVLLIMGVLSTEGSGPNSTLKMYELIFPEKEREKIKKLKLQYKDFTKIVESAIDLILDKEENEGE